MISNLYFWNECLFTIIVLKLQSNIFQTLTWPVPRLVNFVPALRGSQRFMRLVRIDLCDRFAMMINLRQKKRVHTTYRWLVYVIICPWSIIEFCRTFRRDVATKKQQIVTFEVKNIGNNRNKSIISYFDENIRQWWPCGCRHLSMQLFSIHPCL